MYVLGASKIKKKTYLLKLEFPDGLGVGVPFYADALKTCHAIFLSYLHYNA